MSRGHIQLSKTSGAADSVHYDVETAEYTYDGTTNTIGDLTLYPGTSTYKFEARGQFAKESYWPPEFFGLDAVEQARVKRRYENRTHRVLMRKVHIAAKALLEVQQFPERYTA